MTDDHGRTATATMEPPPPTPPGAPPATGFTGPHPPRPSRSGGVKVGILLIIIGLVFLAAQFTPGVNLFTMWPLIIVLVGAIQALTPDRDGYWSVERFFDGLVTVAFGLVFLAITLGYVDWSVWWSILMLWPVLLISAGLGIIGKASHQSWLKALGSIVVIAALAYAVLTSYTGMGVPAWGGSGQGQEFSYDEPVGRLEEADLKVSVGLAETTIGSGSSLISATGDSAFGEPRLAVDANGTKADVEFDLGDERTVVVPDGTDSNVDLRLSDEVLWDATVNAGVSKLDADLSDLRIRRLTLSPGVASCDVRLGDVPTGIDEAVAEVKAGVSTVRVLVPRDAEVRVESDSGLVGHDIAGSLEKVDDGWETAGFSAARDRGDGVWLIRVKSGIGSFSVDTY